MIDAVKHVAGRCKLEASGNITIEKLYVNWQRQVSITFRWVCPLKMSEPDLSMRFNA